MIAQKPETLSPISLRDYKSIDRTLADINWEYSSRRGKGKICDNLIAFDIETSSAFIDSSGRLISVNADAEGKEKVSLCYLWTVAVEYNIFRGRTLESFKAFLEDLTKVVDAQIIIYIHNAAFEFQFLRNVLEGMTVFARENRRPIYFGWCNIEFRCSYMLTRLSLANWAKSKRLPHQKLMGNLDYTILRTPYTILWDYELDYTDADVLVMIDGLQEYKDEYGSVWNIPITQTGIVRREYNHRMAGETKYQKHMRDIYPKSIAEYKELLDVFSGGYTHANMMQANITLKNVTSRDATSAYPWHMLSKTYPNTRFYHTQYNTRIVEDSVKFSWIADLEFYNIKSFTYNTYISGSKCTKIVGAVYDNGRIIQADYLRIKITNVDFDIIKRCYKYDILLIRDFAYAINDYLPDILCRYIAELFCDKTKLKNVVGREALYAKKKEHINAMFGMAVCRDIKDDIEYIDEDWTKILLTPELYDKKLSKKLRNLSRLNTSVQSGVWITAYQRQSLWSFILSDTEMDFDTVYMDTDSNKHFNEDMHAPLFAAYNAKVRQTQLDVCDRLGIAIDMLRPKDIKGREQSIGEYVIDEVYDEFKTLGAKRYAFKQDGKIGITVSGVPKSAAGVLTSLDEFKDGLIFPPEKTGKNILSYNDNQGTIVFNKGGYDEFVSAYRYGVCVYPTGYKLGLGEYLDLLCDLANHEENMNSQLFRRGEEIQ